MEQQNQQEQRRAAKDEFFQSLDQLEHILHECATQEEATPELDTVNHDLVVESSVIDMEAFEEAVADIEQYLKGKKE